ncbi:MAG: hypothetical protein JNM27_16110 [Leptospirales bacterium]|nr:hypothetical protein [Leptospirales bacterium]
MSAPLMFSPEAESVPEFSFGPAPRLTSSLFSEEVPLLEHEFDLMRQLIYDRTGICIADSKRALLIGRLGTVVKERGLRTFQEYYDLLQRDTTGDLLTELFGRITTNYTYFNREPDHFQYLTKNLLPSVPKNERIRLWSAGCATGPEAFDLSMHLQAHLDATGYMQEGMVLGTDISRKAIEFAVKGVYPVDAARAVPPENIPRYLEPVDKQHYSVKPRIKNLVKFRVMNLLREVFPFQQKFHAIFCRNVMIYFDEATRMKLVKHLAEHLLPGGILVLGHCESLLSVPGELKGEGASVYSRRA